MRLQAALAAKGGGEFERRGWMGEKRGIDRRIHFEAEYLFGQSRGLPVNARVRQVFFCRGGILGK